MQGRLIGGRIARVLVVDDDPEIRELLGYALGTNGFRVVEAADGEEGLARLATDGADCIILDYCMPVLDGLGFLRRLGSRRPPVIFFTAIGVPHIDADLSVDAIVHKPTEVLDIVRLVRSLVTANEKVERRNHPRLPLRRTVEVLLPGNETRTVTRTIDISAGGLCFHVSAPPHAGAMVSVLVPNGHGAVELPARVRHARADGRVGVEFVSVDVTQRMTIARLIDEANSKTSR